MGEMADFVNDIMLEDDPEYEPERFVKCRYCGYEPLFWEKFTNGWRLVNWFGEFHRCKNADNKES